MKRAPLKRTAFKVKEGRKLVRKAMSRTPKGTRSKWMKEADKWFSEYIRLINADEMGYVTCVTSGKRMFWRDADCGHWLSRAKMATRYDERNAHPQAPMQNRFQGGHFFEHGLAIERIHGKGTRDELEKKVILWDATGGKASLDFFRNYAEHFREKVKAIKESEPQKYNRAA